MIVRTRRIYILYLLYVSSVLGYSISPYDFKFYRPTKIYDSIEVDGQLNEKQWLDSKSINDFIQVEPNILDNPTEKTSVKILYDNKYIYFGIVLYQDNNTLAYKMGDYDDFINSFENNSDFFVIELDTQNKHDSSYGFAINASNVRADYMVYGDEDGNVDDYWNASWKSEVIIKDDSWVIEVAIPMSELRFSSNSKQDWGINFIRYIKSKNETSIWSFIPEFQNKFISQYGHLLDLDIKYSNNFKLKPYLLMGDIEYNDVYYDVAPSDDGPVIVNKENPINLNKKNNKNKLGFNFKYRFRSSNVFDFTLNPDYGQINQDPSVINNTAYEIEFDEKRPFFLENSSFYQTPIRIFYSRRIGGDVVKQGDDLFNNITFDTNFKKAFSYLGDKHNVQYGFLYAESRINESDYIPIYQNPNFDDFDVKYFVLRNKYKISDSGSIGFLATYYEKPAFELGYSNDRILFPEQKNNTIAIDFAFNLSSLYSITLDGQIAQVNNNGIIANALNVELDYVNYFSLYKYIDCWFKIENYDKNFDISKMGYLFRNDLKDVNIGLAFTNQKPDNAQNRKLILKYLLSKNHNNKIIQNNFDVSFNNTFQNFHKISLGYSKDFKHYIDRFYDMIHFNSNEDIYTKGILYDKFSFEFSNDQRLLNSYTLGFEYFVDNFEDTGKRLMFHDRYKINDRLEFEFSFDEKKLFSKYHFLKMKEINNSSGINRIIVSDYDYLFVNSQNQEKTVSFQISSKYSNSVTIQFYSEFYKYLNDWDTNEVFVIEKDNLDSYPIKDTNNNLDIQEDGIIYISDYSSVMANFVIKVELYSNSYLHFVYSIDKGINGRSFNNPLDVLGFSRNDINQDNLAEIYYGESFFIKFNILFNN